MNARKVQIDKNWLDAPSDKKNTSSVRKLHKFEQMTVTKSEDLPALMNSKEAAALLRRCLSTIREYRLNGDLRFMKIKGRYFTTPEYIADFLEREMKNK